eukprot:1132479-Pyramimonas_sp.AAC.1
MALRGRRTTLAARAAHPVNTLSVWMWALRQIPLDSLRRQAFKRNLWHTSAKISTTVQNGL